MVNRREFVKVGMMWAAVAARLRAQPRFKRAAVLIGVDHAGQLPALRGAASGAQSVDAWLRDEEFETILFSDATHPVRVNEIYDAVAALIDRGTLDQLVIYFAGHGFISNYSEFWMLTGAPANPNEAISLRESVELAKTCGVPNVVFISDACRSRSDSLGTERVRGSLIFPNRNTAAGTNVDVDIFLATRVGDAAYEVPLGISAASYEGIYTAAFMNAFAQPDQGMIRSVGGVNVVPNNRLKSYLQREVQQRVAAISIRNRQIPDSQVVSGDDTYIGKARGGSPWAPLLDPPPPPALDRAAASALARVGMFARSAAPAINPDELKALERDSGFRDAYQNANDDVVMRVDTTSLGSAGGIVLFGEELANVRTSATAAGEALPQARPSPIPTRLVRARIQRGAPASVVLEFRRGGGTIVAALFGYVAYVVVDDGRVMNIRYVPAQGPRIDPELADLHAVVAASARYGVFRIEGGENRQRTAAQIADRIRARKSADPTLGIYAAYAYSDANLPAQIVSVAEFMRSDLGVDLYDVALLSGTLSVRSPQSDRPAVPVVPFMPMLSQGWNLLRAKNVVLPPSLAPIRDHIRESLWTTLDAEGVAIASRFITTATRPTI